MCGVVVGVFAAAEDLLLLGEHADDREDIAFDLHLLADGGVLAEELFGGVVAEDDDVGAALLFFVGEEAALVEDHVIDHGLLLGVAFEHGVGELVALVLDGEAAEVAGGRAVLLRGIDSKDMRQVA